MDLIGDRDPQIGEIELPPLADALLGGAYPGLALADWGVVLNVVRGVNFVDDFDIATVPDLREVTRDKFLVLL